MALASVGRRCRRSSVASGAVLTVLCMIRSLTVSPDGRGAGFGSRRLRTMSRRLSRLTSQPLLAQFPPPLRGPPGPLHGQRRFSPLPPIVAVGPRTPEEPYIAKVAAHVLCVSVINCGAELPNSCLPRFHRHHCLQSGHLASAFCIEIARRRTGCVSYRVLRRAGSQRCRRVPPAVPSPDDGFSRAAHAILAPQPATAAVSHRHQ
jgi:hypothetical protein